MALLLTMTESDSSVISGVPEYVEFETSEPANVFYTFDGTLPDEADLIAVERVYMPTHGKGFTLRAIAISVSEESSVLEEEYSTDVSNLTRVRNLAEEGINILPFGEDSIDHLAVNPEGQEAQKTTISFLDLDIKTSTTNSLGESLSNNTLSTETTHSFINFPDKVIGAEVPYTSSVHDSEFYPTAKVIIIDGSTQDLLESQVVRIINRPHGTTETKSAFYNDHLVRRATVSGSFVRSMYNPKTGKAVFYYRDNRDNKWVKSIQSVETKKINTGPGASGFVFKWIENRTNSSIY